MGRDLGPVVAGAALAEEAPLLPRRHDGAAQRRQSRLEAGVALALELGELPAGHAVRVEDPAVEALGDARRVEVGEGPHRAQPQSLARRREVPPAERGERLSPPEGVAAADGHDHALARRPLGAEEALGHTEVGLDADDLEHAPAHEAQHRVVAAEEAARPAQRQREQPEAHRLGEGAEGVEGVEQLEGRAQRRPVGRLGAERLDPDGEEALH